MTDDELLNHGLDSAASDAALVNFGTVPDEPPHAAMAPAAPQLTLGSGYEAPVMGALRGGADLGNTLLNAQDWANAHVPPFSWIPGNPAAAQARMGERAQYLNDYQKDYGSNPLAQTARLGVNVAETTPFMLAAPELTGLGGNALMGAGGAALLSGGSNMPLHKQLALGAFGGAAIPAAVNTVAGAISPALPFAAQYLRQMGVELTPGQLLGGAWNRLEQGAQSLPGIGDLIKNRTIDSFRSFHKAVGNEALAPVGARIPDNVAPGNASVDYVASELGSRYDDILSRGSVAPANVIANAQNMAAQVQNLLPHEQAQSFVRVLQTKVIDAIHPGQAITGETYKQMDTALRNFASKYGKSQDPWENELGDRLEDARAYLLSEFEGQNPQLAGELQPLNQSWARLERYRQATASQAAGKNDGIFTPEQYNAAVRAMDDSKSKWQYARGRAMGQRLSQAANEVMGSKVPDSGTPYRSMLPLVAALAGQGAGVPHMPEAIALGMLGAAPYTQPGMRLLNALLTQRPQALQAGGGVLRQVAPYTAPLGGALNPLLSTAE